MCFTDRGDYVVRENQNVDGVYFLLQGQAQVLRSAGEENYQEFPLKRYDFFGHGIFGDVYSADVVAVTELTCLLLMSDHRALLEIKSVSDSDKERCLVEDILYLEPLDLNVYRGFTPPNAPTYGKVYGGQLVGQALAAASKTVETMKIVHNFHCYFLLVGDINIPIIYDVNRLRDGNNFATRSVDARQKGKTIFTLFASFQKKQQGFIHQESTMPHTPAPETLLPREEMLERLVTEPLLPRDYRNQVATEISVPFPIDIRFCEPNRSTKQNKSPPRLKYWFRAKGKLSDDDQALHRCVVAFASDLIFATISLNPHRREGMSVAALSLDHSMWFHRPVRADDWLLFVIVSPTATESRGFATGKMFNRKGELVVSLTQEAVLREAVTIKPSFGAKL
ncbi:Acyl-CoA thioesterase family protein [Arabidopsis thaliana]|jgi:acyl-coenzyme A thioesterase 1/2/4|uniref:Acyl-CoA thioesterase family protein n=1 Tax=Arabidopsis thaliana TaxID=3702 RepID=B3H5Z2_ARATH|nr:Acyl-CoA thioesterase family protein [Arabidopsis thaliana]NP_001328328.1 Acyl-CoA thioesterase family protein [Arabidopsis thaliana]AEE81893.2 Acyl-CoA thioesterase family protein [Arabidopsis thaliana]ANM66432.1 Acyl-CoA thioesterase family protein [Arabidopsis thaliana]|eukprot:NP_001319833.1 Acyl-CoA thioesterase family protein [Arabidopsis thaliana]